MQGIGCRYGRLERFARSRRLWLAVIATLAAMGAIPAGANATPTLTTGKADYHPGEVVDIYGVGFDADETYAMPVKRPDGSIVLIDPTTHMVIPGQGWDFATADEFGNFFHDYQLNGIKGEYEVRAYPQDWNGDWSQEPVASVKFLDNASATPSQCANGSLTDPPRATYCPDPPGSNPVVSDWVKGQLGSSKSHYFEGDSIPYRMVMAGLEANQSHTLAFSWDTTKNGKHAIDYLTTFNRSVPTANPCAGVANCPAPTSFPIPDDPEVVAAGVTPIPGSQFKMYGGTITAVSAYTIDPAVDTTPPFDPHPYTGDSTTQITVTFTASTTTPVLAWGGHIATRQQWGAGNAAVSIPGSPYHTSLVGLNGDGGNQDMALSADAVIFPSSIRITKDAIPEGATSFPYTATVPNGAPAIAGFNLVDDGDPAAPVETQLFSNLINFGTFTFTEAVPANWQLQNVTCTESNTGSAGDQDTATTQNGPGATLNLDEGEDIHCTYHNRSAKLELRKNLTPDSDPGRFDLNIDGGTPEALSQGENGTTGIKTLAPGTHTVTEAADANTNGANYDSTLSCVTRGIGTPVASPGGSVQLAAGDDVVCTFTNARRSGTLTVVKDLQPSTDAGRFDLRIGNTVVANNAGDGQQRPPDGRPGDVRRQRDGRDPGRQLDHEPDELLPLR